MSGYLDTDWIPYSDQDNVGYSLGLHGHSISALSPRPLVAEVKKVDEDEVNKAHTP